MTDMTVDKQYQSSLEGIRLLVVEERECEAEGRNGHQ
jgi:hypothetical protein